MHERWFLSKISHQVIPDTTLIQINCLETPLPLGSTVSLSVTGDQNTDLPPECSVCINELRVIEMHPQDEQLKCQEFWLVIKQVLFFDGVVMRINDLIANKCPDILSCKVPNSLEKEYYQLASALFLERATQNQAVYPSAFFLLLLEQ